MKLYNKGFTLIELMIVVSIIGILVAVAYPSYTVYVRNSNRADAIDSLTPLAARMEVFYLNNDTYVGATVVDATSPEGFYTLSISAADAFNYTIAATLVDPASDPECTSLTLNSLGQRGATGTNPPECW